VMGIQPDIAGQGRSVEPEDGICRVEPIDPNAVHIALGDGVERNTLPGIVHEALTDRSLALLHQDGIVALAPQGGHQQTAGQPVPVGEDHVLPRQAGLQTGIDHGIIDRQRRPPCLALVMVAEGPDRRLDPRLIPTLESCSSNCRMR